MAVRKLNYADITHLTEKQRADLLVKMRSGYNEMRTKMVKRRVGRQWILVAEDYSHHVPALVVWTETVQGRCILYGKMSQDDCPVPLLEDEPKRKEEKQGDGGMFATPSPFPPLEAEPSSDTPTDRARDAALRDCKGG